MSTYHEYRWQKGISRYYRILIYKDLLGSLMLTCIWGGMSSRLGNYSHTVYETMKDALEFVDDMKKRRTKRGYVLKLEK